MTAGCDRFSSKFVDGIGRVDPKYFADVNRWCSDMLAFNALRFVEYTFSGSLVLVTIGMIAGIVDVELLSCIFLLSASCMLMGLVAEYCMRGRVALKAIEKNLPGSDFEKLSYVFQVVRVKLAYAFWISHILAWVCILLPWYIIYLHYESWWDQCKFVLPAASPSATPAPATTSEPPDFVKIIVFAQAILFLLFGVVQLVQFFMPHKRRATEVSYIMLSLTAKVLLGVILSVNVLLA